MRDELELMRAHHLAEGEKEEADDRADDGDDRRDACQDDDDMPPHRAEPPARVAIPGLLTQRAAWRSSAPTSVRRAVLVDEFASCPVAYLAAQRSARLTPRL